MGTLAYFITLTFPMVHYGECEERGRKPSCPRSRYDIVWPTSRRKRARETHTYVVCHYTNAWHYHVALSLNQTNGEMWSEGSSSQQQCIVVILVINWPVLRRKRGHLDYKYICANYTYTGSIYSLLFERGYYCALISSIIKLRNIMHIVYYMKRGIIQ
jgi:hypothetical protein